MASLLEIHNKAMDMAESATILQNNHNQEEALILFHQALELEKQAAQKLATAWDKEPTRSVLYRSAASLALDCKDFREAERLIASALIGNPPSEIAEELRNLLEQSYFERHLGLRGVELIPSDIQLSIAGKEVGYGMALTNAFVSRVTGTQKLLYRTANRLIGLSFKEANKMTQFAHDNFTLYNTIPRPGSFAVTFRLGHPEQSKLPGLEDPENILDEFMSCLDIFNRSDEKELKDKISDESYYRNFVGLARIIAPDGPEVNFVGLSITRSGREKNVAMTKSVLDNKEWIKAVVPEEELKNKVTPVEITGELKLADAAHKRNRILVVDAENVQHSIIVPEGMMSDIVKPLWEEVVRVKGRKKGKNTILDDIELA